MLLAFVVARVLTTTTVEVVEEIEGFKAPQRIRRREQNHYFLCHLTGVVLCCCCSEEFDDDDRNEQIIPHHQFSNRCCGRFSFSLSPLVSFLMRAGVIQIVGLRAVKPSKDEKIFQN